MVCSTVLTNMTCYVQSGLLLARKHRNINGFVAVRHTQDPRNSASVINWPHVLHMRVEICGLTHAPVLDKLKIH